MSNDNQLRFFRERHAGNLRNVALNEDLVRDLEAEVSRLGLMNAEKMDRIDALTKALDEAKKAGPDKAPAARGHSPLWSTGGNIPGKMQDGSYASASPTARPAMPTEAPLERGPPTLELEPPTNRPRGSSEPNKNVSRR